MDGKIKIIIASILKPVDDTRAYEKIGRSLAQTNKYEVNIIGFESKKTPSEKNISFIPLFNANRKHISRFISPIKFFRILIKVKPKVVIVNTPELLIVSYLNRILFGSKIIYDIRENYQMNLAYDNTYKNWQKPLLKLYLSIVEGLSPYFVIHFLLAERVYANQLKFIKNSSYTIIENKTAIVPDKEIQIPIQFTSKQPIKFIITGTLGHTYGTLEGIAFFQRLKLYLQGANLVIIGYSADKTYKTELEAICNRDKDIELVLANGPVSHDRIIKAIKLSDMALLPYQLNDNLSQRIPTKIYEYIALYKPMLIPENKLWNSLLSEFSAGISIDFKTQNIQELYDSILGTAFYKKHNLNKVSWKSEEIKLLNIIKSID